MNYKMHYEKLIERAKNRQLTGYVEKHHIIPKCMGGKNNKENIVILTPEEHYFAHYILVKIYPDNHRLLWAVMAMCNKTKTMERSNKPYGWMRRKFAETIAEKNRGQKRSEESKKKMSEARIGRKFAPHSEETKIKMSEASKGKPKSEEHRIACSLARSGKKYGSHSKEWNENISNAQKGKPRPKLSDKAEEKYRATQSEIMKEVWKQRKAGLLPKPVYKNEREG